MRVDAVVPCKRSLEKRIIHYIAFAAFTTYHPVSAPHLPQPALMSPERMPPWTTIAPSGVSRSFMKAELGAGWSSIGVPLIATSSHAAQSIEQATLPWPCAWVLGHEGQGASSMLMQQCRATVRIPQPGGEESLNVAAAAAVCFYESARQRAG